MGCPKGHEQMQRHLLILGHLNIIDVPVLTEFINLTGFQWKYQQAIYGARQIDPKVHMGEKNMKEQLENLKGEEF